MFLHVFHSLGVGWSPLGLTAELANDSVPVESGCVMGGFSTLGDEFESSGQVVAPFDLLYKSN